MSTKADKPTLSSAAKQRIETGLEALRVKLAPNATKRCAAATAATQHYTHAPGSTVSGAVVVGRVPARIERRDV